MTTVASTPATGSTNGSKPPKKANKSRRRPSLAGRPVSQDRRKTDRRKDVRRADDRVGGPVNHPAHYNTGKIEVIDAIEDWGLDFHAGNTVKYVARAGKKDRDKQIVDLKKGRWYLDRLISNLEKAAKAKAK